MFSVDWKILLIPELVIWGTEAWGRENSGKWGRIHGLSALSGLSSTVVCIPLSFPPHQPIILIHCFLERSSFTFYCTRRKIQVVIRLGVMNGVAIIKSKLYLAKQHGVKKKMYNTNWYSFLSCAWRSKTMEERRWSIHLGYKRIVRGKAVLYWLLQMLQ